MIIRTVICNRCKFPVTEPHPDRITVATQHYEEYPDYFGKKHRKSVYKVEQSLHLCSKCKSDFKSFMNGAQLSVDLDDEDFK